VDGQWVIQLRRGLDDSLLVVYLELQDILRGVPTYLGLVRLGQSRRGLEGFKSPPIQK
jgi:hypothetical protein